jgi:hypothetical protein
MGDGVFQLIEKYIPLAGNIICSQLAFDQLFGGLL